LSTVEVVVAATANEHKLGEMVAVLGSTVDLRPRPIDLADVIEDGADLVDNARLKATAVGAATGLAALADDTGLEVAALGGAPGVITGRYAGEGATDAENMAKLLTDLGGVIDRSARFRTVLVLLRPDGTQTVAEGIVEGVIATASSGGGGFGYDPVFVPDEFGGRTFAEMSPEEKNEISHRGRALRALLADLAGA
jgi:XTP/dITP diphosphohydrolase